MTQKLKTLSGILASIVCFALVMCASLLAHKDITATYKGKVVSFDTSFNHETNVNEINIYFELDSGHKSAAIFYCLKSAIKDCHNAWSDAVQDGKINGYREFINSTLHSPWTKGKVTTSTEQGLVTVDRPYLLLFSKVLIGVFVLLLVMAIWPIKSKEINHDKRN